MVCGQALVDLVIDPEGAVTAELGGGPFNAARAIARLLAAMSPSSARFRAIASARSSSTLVPMDGFHLLNDDLVRLGRRGRKGPPTPSSSTEMSLSSIVSAANRPAK
jgi:hypothetical protein